MFSIPVLSYSSKYSASSFKSNNNFEKIFDKKVSDCVDNYDFNFDFQPKFSNVSFGCVA